MLDTQETTAILWQRERPGVGAEHAIAIKPVADQAGPLIILRQGGQTVVVDGGNVSELMQGMAAAQQQADAMHRDLVLDAKRRELAKGEPGKPEEASAEPAPLADRP